MAYRAVLFDCDSTLSDIEGIDELAREHRSAIAPLTDAAMRGAISLESVYGKRLEIIRPSAEEMVSVGALYVQHVVPGALETIGALRRLGVDVRIISGGLRPAVLALGRWLGIPDDSVYAVDVYFDAEGQYAGYDTESPLARQGGKPALISGWSDLARPAMMVGDGSTDLEARAEVDTFVAFAGVVERSNVVAAADHVVRAYSLLPVLALALGDATVDDEAIRSLRNQGRDLLSP